MKKKLSARATNGGWKVEKTNEPKSVKIINLISNREQELANDWGGEGKSCGLCVPDVSKHSDWTRGRREDSRKLSLESFRSIIGDSTLGKESKKRGKKGKVRVS